MNLDLCADGNLLPEHIERLNAVGREARRQYTDFITGIALPHQDDMTFWASELASRNIFACPLFDDLCHLLLVKDLLDRGSPITSIVVDSQAKAKALRTWLAEAGRAIPVRYKPSLRLILRAVLKPAYNWGYCAFTFALRFFAARWRPSPLLRRQDDPWTLVVTWASERSFRQGELVDRFYGPMLNFVPEAQRGSIVFLANPEKTWKVFRYHKLVSEAHTPILLREHLLHAVDFLQALMHPFRALRLRWGNPRFEGFVVGDLLRANSRLTMASISTLEGLLGYHFAQRLKTKAIPIRLIIDWFENQAISHGSNAGFRRFLPDVPLVGYQAILTTDFYLSTFPTTLESRARVIPQKIAVIGQGFIETKKEFCPDLNVVVAPAFRFGGVWNAATPGQSSSGFTVLIGLTALLQTSVEIMELALAALEQLDVQPSCILIKPHPIMPLARVIEQVSRPLPARAEIFQGSFDAAIERAHILISSVSSMCMESVVRGLPTLIIGSRKGLTMNPVPADVPASLSKVCFDPADLAEGIRSAEQNWIHAGHESLVQTGRELRSQYFEKASTEGTLEFLALSSDSGGTHTL